MIKAVIFDCFGVLATDGWLPFKDKYFSENKNFLEQATDLNKKNDAGLISYDNFIQGVAKLANITEAETFREIEDNRPNKKLFSYISSLKKDYKIGMLSNAGDDWLDEIFTTGQIALFDAVALSYETGIIKPDIRSYGIIAKRLKVKAGECVFIDDQPRYCEGAKEAGMRAILYEDFQQMKADLEQIL